MHSRAARIGAHHAHRFAMQFNSTQISPTVAINKDAFPNSPPDPEGRIKSIHLPTQAQVSRVSFWTQISGFRSLCGRKQRSSFSHRAQVDLRFGTFQSGRALALRTLASTRDIPIRVSTGPATLDRRCQTNVVAPAEYSKWFFCILMGLYDGFLRPATARRMPARSARAGPRSVNPAAVIRSWTSPSWPSPTSTTSAPPGASSRAACGTSAR